MNVDRLTKEYLKHLDHQKKLEELTKQLKDLLRKAIEDDGEPDENGHIWLPSGHYLLKLQKSQPTPKLDVEKAEEWAKRKGIWTQVSELVQVLSEDRLMAYMYDHQDEEGLEAELESLYIRPDPVYSFIRPVEQEEIEY